MEGRCARCLHWNREYAHLAGWGICEKTNMHSEKPTNPPTTAVAHGEHWRGWLETAPTHGCTMFEAKE